VLNTPQPLNMLVGELTNGYPNGNAAGSTWTTSVLPIPVKSPWGIEVCRRTFLMLAAMASARLGKQLALTLRAVFAHGFYFGLPATLKETELRRDAKSLREAIDGLINQDVPIVQRSMLAPELAAAFSQRGAEISAEAARVARCMYMPCHAVVDGADTVQMPTHGHYTATTMPSFADLRGSRVTVTPIVSTSGFFVQFAPPGLPLMKYNEPEQQALLVAIAELNDNARILQTESAPKINEIVSVGGERACKRHIELAEGRLARRVSSFADKVVANRPRLLLVTSPLDGGAECLAQALELQLRVRELRGICVDVDLWRPQPTEAVRIGELRNDLLSLFTTGSVTVQADEGAPEKTLELPQGGYVLLYGEELHKALLPGADGAPPPLADLPTPPLCIQALPLVCINLDDYSCVGGGALLLLRLLAKSLKPGGVGVLKQLKLWKQKRPVDCERASEHIDLASVGGAIGEWKPLNFSFAHELPIYASLLTRHLAAVPISDSIYPESRRLFDLLSAFDPMPLSYLPSHSPVRVFCGGE